MHTEDCHFSAWLIGFFSSPSWHSMSGRIMWDIRTLNHSSGLDWRLFESGDKPVQSLTLLIELAGLRDIAAVTVEYNL